MLLQAAPKTEQHCDHPYHSRILPRYVVDKIKEYWKNENKEIMYVQRKIDTCKANIERLQEKLKEYEKGKLPDKFKPNVIKRCLNPIFKLSDTQIVQISGKHIQRNRKMNDEEVAYAKRLLSFLPPNGKYIT